MMLDRPHGGGDASFASQRSRHRRTVLQLMPNRAAAGFSTGTSSYVPSQPPIDGHLHLGARCVQ